MSYGIEKVAFFSSGSGNVRKRFAGDPWKMLEGREIQSILLSLAKGPRMLTDIQKELGLDLTSIKDGLRALCKAKIVVVRKGRWRATFITLMDNAASSLAVSLEPMVDKITNVLSESIRSLKQIYERTVVAGHYAWDDFAHIMVDALMLDFIMLGCADFISLGTGFYNLWSEEQCETPFFGLEMGPHQLNLGVNSYQMDGYGISVMHSTLFSRRLPMSEINEILREKAVRKYLAECLDRGGRAGHTAAPKILSEMGWIVKTNRKQMLSIPFLNDNDIKTLTTIGLEVGHKAGKIIVENLDVIVHTFEELGFRSWIKGIGDFATIALHFPLALVPAKLAKKGLLPEIPKEAPMTWGTWAWAGPWTIDLRILAEHLLGDAEAALTHLESKDRRRKEVHLLRARSHFEGGKPEEALQALNFMLSPSHARLGLKRPEGTKGNGG